MNFKQKFVYFVVSILFIFSSISHAQVEIPDPNLRAKIEEQLGKRAGEQITIAEMKTLTRLTAKDSSIKDLTGLEHATRLEHLVLERNLITDVSPLSGLVHLKELHCWYNSITDISVLSGLRRLTVLELAFNSITDISVLSNFVNLGSLTLSFNPIEADLSPISGLPHLSWLQLSGTQISDISVLSNLTQLRGLSLSVNRISNISTLSKLPHLRKLWIDSNSISDISVLSGLTQLIDLGLGHNPITDISAISGLTGLKILHINGLSISDLSPISGMVQLERLFADDILATDISVLSNLTNLKYFDFENNSHISDISVLSNLTSLEELYLTNTQLYLGNTLASDISVLSELVRLKKLNLDGILSLSDISALSNFTQLEWVKLQHTSITDVSVLADLPKLREVYVRGLSLTYPSIHTHLHALKERGVKVHYTERNPTTLKAFSSDPLVVRVRDEHGDAFEGVPVNFAIVEGRGVIQETVATDKNGKAQAIFECNSSTGFNTISASVEEIGEPLIFNIVNEIGFDLTLPAGVSLIHIPLNITAVNEVATTIETLSDLYDVLGGSSAVSILITYDSTIQRWAIYTGARDKGEPSDQVLTNELGIIASMKHPTTLHLQGTPLGTNGQSAVMLCPGINLIGIPLKDSRITYASDILKLEGIAGNVSTLLVEDNGRIKVVAEFNDEGDLRVRGGQSFILVAEKSVEVDIKGWGWSSGIEKGLEFLEDLLSN